MTDDTEIGRRALFGKLNPLLFKAVEGATVFCKLRGNPYVELSHWLHQVLQLQDSDLLRILRHFKIDEARVLADLQKALDGLPRGSTAISDLSGHIENAIERAWVYGTLLYGDAQVRSGYLLVGLLKTPGLKNVLLSMSREFGRLPTDEATSSLSDIVSGSPEDAQQSVDGQGLAGAVPGEASNAMEGPGGKQSALQKFGSDLTAKARAGDIDPVTGRDAEIRQIIDVLMRRRQNNPLLTGEAGVGKTAIAEGFALRVARGDVPPALRDVVIHALDIGLLQAGASMKGEFEQRLRQVIDEVQASPKPIILFVDEVHTLIGAGGQAGTGDAANLLKPALARGTLRTIGATTWAEYKKYIEKDPALSRRFQAIQVDEPDEERAIAMLRGVVAALEKHHGVKVLDQAVEASVRLSHRYIPSRQLPDKAVSLLDTACARVAISQHATPARIEDLLRREEGWQLERQIVLREELEPAETARRLATIDASLAGNHEVLVAGQERWEREKALAQDIAALRAQIQAELEGDAPADAGAVPAAGNALERLHAVQAELRAMQDGTPLVMPSVDEQTVATVVAEWTGIPVGRMVKNEAEAALQLTETLSQRVIGQRHALESIAKRIRTSKAKLDDPGKPVGVFLLCGPSGVGKTETALALAETFYGGEQNIITINMSEYQEAHTVSGLKGAPPGYVGYGEGGVLTEAVRRRPYSVVLLDEIEKAHSDVHEIFFQVFDKGWMEDGEGRYIDFRNTIIILTSNVGTDLLTTMCADPDLMPAIDALTDALRQPLLKVFPPAFLGRLVVVPYLPLTPEMLETIIRLQLERIRRRISENHGVAFDYDDAAIGLIRARCNQVESGGRAIDAILTNNVLPEIGRELLSRVLSGNGLEKVSLTAVSGELNFAYL